jgi:tetratricopeptide (TPR) repeat protein
MLDPDTITQQLTLLAAHRRTLAHLIEQAAQFGGEVFAPPQTANGMTEARAEIARIKRLLRESSVSVEDEPNDEKPPQPEAAVPQQTKGGDQITVGAIVGSTAVAIGAGAQATATTYQMPKLDPALYQFRAPVGDFVGREREIDQLVWALTKGSGGAISGVRGLGGIGKTELAYVVANKLKEVFPDAQLLIELRGVSSSPLSPERALQMVIRSFEREAKLPDDLTELQGIYHSLLTGKKALILADDAKDAAQVRLLLPPYGCGLLVTSRNRFSLPGMVALDLGMPSPEEAEKLLLLICPRIGEYAPKVAKLCGYLPLALRVSAGLLEANDTREVARYLDQLEVERLKHLADSDNSDDPQASVEASLRLSYEALGPDARAALCQLSVFPTSFDGAAAQGVVEIAGDVTEALELLRRRSLLEWDAQLQRFSLHDLVRALAAARLEDADAVRLRHAWHYYKRLSSFGDQRELYLKGQELAGLAFFDRERTHIDAGWGWARERAGDLAADALIVLYANVTTHISNVRYDDIRREYIPHLEADLLAARRLGDNGLEGVALNNLASAYARLGDVRDVRKAIAFYEQDSITRESRDRLGEQQRLNNLASAYARLGDVRNLRKAIGLYQQARIIAHELGNFHGEGLVLNNLGLAYAHLGDVRKAIASCEQSIAIARELGDHHNEGLALNNLGLIYFALGDVRKAIASCEQSIAIARELGDRRGESDASWNLGLSLEKKGDLAQATELMWVSVNFLRETGHPDAERRATYLEQLRQRLTGSGKAAERRLGWWRRFTRRG